MTAGNDHACFVCFFVAAAQHLVDHFLGHLRRYGHNIQRNFGRCAHCIHIADGIRRCNLPEHKGIIYDGRKKIQRLYNGKLVAHLINSCIITGIIAHQQFFVSDRRNAL